MSVKEIIARGLVLLIGAMVALILYGVIMVSSGAVANIIKNIKTI
jgi:hypothetical protein